MFFFSDIELRRRPVQTVESRVSPLIIIDYLAIRAEEKEGKKGRLVFVPRHAPLCRLGRGVFFGIRPDCQLPAKKLRETHELFALFLRQYCLSLSLFCQAKQWAGLRIVFRTSRPFRLLSLASFILGRSGLTLCTATPGTLYRSMNNPLLVVVNYRYLGKEEGSNPIQPYE